MQNRTAGFTLIELLIVVVILAIIAAMAIPNFLSARTAANERAVIAALRSIATAQIQCQSRAVVDADRDGRGEALGLDEMVGVRSLRTSGLLLSPACLPASIGNVNAVGRSTGHGYLMSMHLPDATGIGLVALPANDASIAADHAESCWSCIAWPITKGRSGTATYFVNQGGEILMSRDANYSGVSSVPPPGAALTGVAANMIVGGTLAINTNGADGNRWMMVR